jgi:DUF1680 family protein
MATRRQFSWGLVGAGAAAGVAARAAAAAAVEGGRAALAAGSPSPPGPSFGGATAAGELAERIRLTADRLTHGGRPEYTRDFILADVALDQRRRFWEFSGDLSGRYLEALSILPPAGAPDLGSLARGILAHQREDGRFGDPALRYVASEIAMPHMALLWGNGRLLVGLLQYHAASKDPQALAAARRLADFLVGIRAQAADPAVAKRVDGQGAFGIICFTQLVEPLVALSARTGDGRYLSAARDIAPSLGPRGIQHAHGYVTTLRGMLDLAAATKDPADLARVERLYAELAASPDLCWMGGVLEYFGWEDPSVTMEQRKALLAASGDSPRDEGCGIADVLRLSLALHRATGKPEYLERAERCLLNHLYFNQFTTGDFGSRSFYRGGTKPTENVDRAWWCCTMHGYRAFPDVLASTVAVAGDAARVDLFLDADWTGHGFDLALRERSRSALASTLDVNVRKAGGAQLAFRKPSWAEAVRARVNGAPVGLVEKDGALLLPRPPRAGDRVELALEHGLVVETRDGRRLAVSALGKEPVEGLLLSGPRIYVVDDGTEPLFFGEPWLGANVVSLGESATSVRAAARPWPFFRPERTLVARYEHGGFVGSHPVSLHPVGEQAGREPGIVAAWLKYRG